MTCEKRPIGWRSVETLDFVHNRRLLKGIAIASLSVVAVCVVIGLLMQPPMETFRLLKAHWLPWALLLPMTAAYICLHELTHGVLMHLMTGKMPKYGFKLCYAYAGSDYWFDKPSHITVALAPVILWGAVLEILRVQLPPEWFWCLWIVQISNLSGAVGDIYCAAHLLRIKGRLLIRDTGTRMIVIKQNEVHS